MQRGVQVCAESGVCVLEPGALTVRSGPVRRCGGTWWHATGSLSGWTYLRSMPWRRSARYKFFVSCCWHTSSRSRAMSADLARSRARARLIDDVIVKNTIMHSKFHALCKVVLHWMSFIWGKKVII